MDEPREQLQTWELLNDELRGRLDVQRASFARIEARAALVLGAAFAALQFVAGRPTHSAWLPLAVVAYIGAMITSSIAVLPGKFMETKPRSILVGLWLYPRGRAAAELANIRLAAFELNVKRQSQMVRLVRISVGLMVIGAIMSVAHLTRGEPGNGNERRISPRPSANGPARPASKSGSA